MVLDGFVAFNFNEGVPYVSITNNGVTFNKAVVMKLNYPAFVQLLINDNSRQIALLPCHENAFNAVSFYKPKNNNVISVRWNAKDLLNTLKDLMGWDLTQEAYKVDGAFVKDENVMLFDLNQATPMK